MTPDPFPRLALEFFTDPRPFLRAAGSLLAAQPLQGSVIATVSERAAREAALGDDSWTSTGAPFARWWAVVRDASGTGTGAGAGGGAGDVVGAAMRTAPFAPHPAYVLDLPEQAALGLARALHARGELLGGVNGVVPAAAVVARETARLHGRHAARRSGLRQWEATAVEVPSPPPGRLRRATEADAELVLAWFDLFHTEADRQAGREPEPQGGNTLDGVLERIREGSQWLWEAPDGEVVHLTGRSLPAYGVSRIGPVFTPRAHRGKGIASYVVAELTRQGLADGSRMCLFTDLDNPVSNRIYARLGYRPVGDTEEWVVTEAGPAGEAP